MYQRMCAPWLILLYYLDVDDEDDIIREALASSEDASADENQKQRWSQLKISINVVPAIY